ncbi:MAG: aldehyde ferredoxin oxidoreductase family protein [Candidatus Bathyarchaeia archaeon]
MRGLKGYAGRVLYVDLSKGSTREEAFDESLARNYVGGAGFASYLLYRSIEPRVDAFEAGNAIVYATGPLSGTVIPGSCKLCIMAKSPLSGFLGETYASGDWAPELKYAGFDALVVQGASEKPVYLWIEDGKAEIRDASRFWGLKTYELWEPLLKDIGDPQAKVLSIGPGGERLVRYASILNFKRAAGRTGIGAVMGSKRLKAIAVRGTKEVEVADFEACVGIAKEALRRIVEEKAGLGTIQHGTTNGPIGTNARGLLGTRNWQEEVFEGAELISGSEMVRRGLRIADKACFSCPLRCSKLHAVREGPYAGYSTEGPEYESLYALGSICGNSNVESLIAADRLCDEYGIDTISTGLTIAFAMELYQRGILSSKDLDGLELSWGNHGSQIELIRRIGERKGIGDLLAEGSKRAAEKLGGEAPKYAMHVKGVEIPGHSPRGVKTCALGYSISPRGAIHTDPASAMFDYDDPYPRDQYKGKGIRVYREQPGSVKTFRNFLGLCGSCLGLVGDPGWSLRVVQRLMAVVTGLMFSEEELSAVAYRTYTLMRCFNVREGATRKDDWLPERFLKEPIPSGPNKGVIVSEEGLKIMIDEYYEAAGWDQETGIPREETLKLLGLGWVADDLKKYVSLPP